MNDQPLNDQPSSRVNQILDLLVEEIEERIQVRRRATPPVKPAVAPPPKAPPPPPPVGVERKNVLSEPQAEAKGHPLDPKPEPDLPPMSPGPSHAARMMGRLALGLLCAIVLINIPFNRHGTTLATALPDSAALVVLDGLVVKEENDEKIYVVRGHIV